MCCSLREQINNSKLFVLSSDHKNLGWTSAVTSAQMIYVIIQWQVKFHITEDTRIGQHH